jgi:GT2 family glycosyltransferase
MKPVDIFITSYLRPQFTMKTLEYLRERTKYPHRVILIDNGGNITFKELVDIYISVTPNIGIHAAWNMALSMAETEYFITSDNDIYVPDLRNMVLGITEGPQKQYVSLPTTLNDKACWLERMVKFMDERPDYGAISLHPHVFIGAAGIDPSDPEDVKERNMCGAVMRLMRTEVVRQAGGWEHKTDPKRNHEERTICSRLQTLGYKVGIASRIRAYHPFGKETGGNWGYPEEITPEMQGHNPALKDYVISFDNPEGYDPKTWLPK